MWIDSHAHLDSFYAANEWPETRERMLAEGVTDVVAIGGTVTANDLAVRLAAADDRIHAVVGYDRDEAGTQPDVNLLRAHVATGQVVGIGETGLDYHYSQDTAQQQCELLDMMLDMAVESALPVVIHTREADRDTEQLLRAYAARWSGPRGEPGVIHCFTGDAAFARRLLDIGFLLSFSGIVTFKKADDLREALRIVPLDRLLVETDAPYLAPVPRRGKRNEPAYVRHVGEGIAAFLGHPATEIAAQTSANARRLFGIPERAIAAELPA